MTRVCANGCALAPSLEEPGVRLVAASCGAQRSGCTWPSATLSVGLCISKASSQTLTCLATPWLVSQLSGPLHSVRLLEPCRLWVTLCAQQQQSVTLRCQATRSLRADSREPRLNLDGSLKTKNRHWNSPGWLGMMAWLLPGRKFSARARAGSEVLGLHFGFSWLGGAAWECNSNAVGSGPDSDGAGARLRVVLQVVFALSLFLLTSQSHAHPSSVDSVSCSLRLVFKVG